MELTKELELDLRKKIELEPLDESTLSRVWQHTQDKDTAFAILTAYRNERHSFENFKLNLVLANKVHRLGFGYFFLEGHTIENEGTPTETKVEEQSIFVIAKPKSKQASERMKHDLLELAKAYEQEGIFWKPAGENNGYIASSDGSLSGPLSLSPDKIGTYYSKLKTGSHAGRDFKFEAALIPRNINGKRIAESRYKS